MAQIGRSRDVTAGGGTGPAQIPSPTSDGAADTTTPSQGSHSTTTTAAAIVSSTPSSASSKMHFSPRTAFPRLFHSWPQQRQPATSPTSPTSPTLPISPISPASPSPESAAAATLLVVAPQISDADYYASPDLLSRDKARQKEAVRKYLEEKIRNDWSFVWSPVKVVVAPTSAASGPGAEPEAGAGADTDNNPPAGPVPAEVETVEEAQSQTTGLSPHSGHSPLSSHSQPAVESGYEVDEEEEGAGADGDDDADAVSTYSTVSEDKVGNFRSRAEWSSEVSDGETPRLPPGMRLKTAESLNLAALSAALAKKADRRRATRKESRWNEGLACFEARRNAWTGARTVRIRTRLPSPPTRSPLSPRRFFFRAAVSKSSAGSSAGSTDAGLEPSLRKSDSSDSHNPAEELGRTGSKQSARSAGPSSAGSGSGSGCGASSDPTYGAARVETLIPIPRPLLPAGNPMRASITPTAYLSIYDKIIMDGLTPSCPVNLSHMIKSCVAGWKRDGEWPPRSANEPRPTADPLALAQVKSRSAATTTAAVVAAAATTASTAAAVASAAADRRNRRRSFGTIIMTGWNGVGGGTRLEEESESRAVSQKKIWHRIFGSESHGISNNHD